MTRQPAYRRAPPSRNRTLVDRVIGVAFIGFLLWLGHLQMRGELGDKWSEFVAWLGTFFA